MDDPSTGLGQVAYAWDNNGNLLDDGERTFAYDSANRLTQVTKDGITAQYTYAGDGTRLAQTVDGVTTQYASDIAAPLPQVLTENKTGTQTAYLYGQGMIAAYDSGNWAYQHPDALGSVRQQTDSTGQVTVARGYAPFGEALWQAGDPGGSFGYAGEQSDPASGLTFLRSRYYDPTTGRFLTKDAYPALAPVPQTLHRYAYVGNDPINRTDPSGESYLDNESRYSTDEYGIRHERAINPAYFSEGASRARTASRKGLYQQWQNDQRWAAQYAHLPGSSMQNSSSSSLSRSSSTAIGMVPYKTRDGAWAYKAVLDTPDDSWDVYGWEETALADGQVGWTPISDPRGFLERFIKDPLAESKRFAKFAKEQGGEFVDYKKTELAPEWREIIRAMERDDFSDYMIQCGDLAYKAVGADHVVDSISYQINQTRTSLSRNLSIVTNPRAIGSRRWQQAVEGAALDAANVVTFGGTYDAYYGLQEGDYLRAASGALQSLWFVPGVGQAAGIAGNVLDLGVAGREAWRGFASGNFEQMEMGLLGVGFNAGQVGSTAIGGGTVAAALLFAGDELGDALARNAGGVGDSVTRNLGDAGDLLNPAVARQINPEVIRINLDGRRSYPSIEEIRKLGIDDYKVNVSRQYLQDIASKQDVRNASLAYRSRPQNAHIFDTRKPFTIGGNELILGNKPGGADTVRLLGWNGKLDFGERQLGLRLVTLHPDANVVKKLIGLRLAVSDLDSAGMMIGGRMVSDEIFKEHYLRPLNESFGYPKDILMHGAQATASQRIWQHLYGARGMKGIMGMLEDEVVVINASGPMEIMPLARYMVDYGFVPSSYAGSANLSPLAKYLVTGDLPDWQANIPYWQSKPNE